MRDPRERYDYNANNVTGTIPIDEENDLVPIALWREEANDAECWRRFCWLTDEAKREAPNESNVRGAIFLREQIKESLAVSFDEWIREQRRG